MEPEHGDAPLLESVNVSRRGPPAGATAARRLLFNCPRNAYWTEVVTILSKAGGTKNEISGRLELPVKRSLTVRGGG